VLQNPLAGAQMPPNIRVGNERLVKARDRRNRIEQYKNQCLKPLLAAGGRQTRKAAFRHGNGFAAILRD
jgi:hypothetical protein